MDMKLPKGSGPSSIVSFRRMSPRNVVPDTTVPTPCDKHSRGSHSDHNPRGLAGLAKSYRHGVGVVDLKLGGLVVSVGRPGGEQVEEHLEQVHVLSGHVGDLKNRTHPEERKAEVTRGRFPSLCCEAGMVQSPL